jgi:restriction system protein
MARKKSNPLEDIVSVFSKFPWWVGILLAIVSYLVLHAIATRPAVTITGPGQMGDAVVKMMIAKFALLGQYVLTFAFGLAGLVSGINSIRQKKLYDRVESRSDVASMNEMNWGDFERLVGEYYHRSGYKVTREGGDGPDGGIDLVLRRDGETHLVQCKQWKAYKVGVQPVREFYGVMSSRGAAGGYFVTTGVYTDEALAFARGLNLDLVDGRKLREMIDFARKTPAASAIKNDIREPAITIVCPKCGTEMKKRVARQGTNVGKEFWGCNAYPKCNGTRPLEVSNSDKWVLIAPPVMSIPIQEKKSCPNCGEDLVYRQFQSGPKIGQNFYGCVPCKKGWPAEQAFNV